MDEYRENEKYGGPLSSLEVARRTSINAKKRGIEYVKIPGF